MFPSPALLTMTVTQGTPKMNLQAPLSVTLSGGMNLPAVPPYSAGTTASDGALVRTAMASPAAPTAGSSAATGLVASTKAFLAKPLYGSFTYGETGLGALALAAVTKLAKVW